MRTPEQKQQVVNLFSPPLVIDDLLVSDEIIQLKNIFNNSKEKIHKNTGPVTLNLTAEHWAHPTLIKIKQKLHGAIGDFDIFASFFFYVEHPHVIHNDDNFTFPLTYKGITIPLSIEYVKENTGFPQLCFFDQYYLDGPSKFYNGDSASEVFYNQPVYDYGSVLNTTTEPFPQEIKTKYLTHLKPQWLHGLSFNQAVESKPGTAIVFDSVRLHCASDFRAQGIKSKLGISIFTSKNYEL